MFLPAGSQDETGRRVQNRFRAFETFRTVTEKRNYKAISTPAVEYADTFTNPFAGMKLQPMLKWFNRQGEIEVLRPDWTTAVARALINQDPAQLKWCYQGSVYRNDKVGTESRQAGIEIIHTPEFLGESECLLTAVAYLKELNIGNYLIELGHTGIFEELTAPLQLNEEETEKLRQAMHDKRRDEVYQLAAGHGSKAIAEHLTSLVDAFGPVDIMETYEQKWQSNEKLLSIIRHLKQLARLLKESGIEDVLVDLGRVKNLPYYCGVMFRGFIKENGATCFSGGRYDKLYEQFSERVSAVGLAFDVDTLAEQLSSEKETETVCILASPETHVYAEKRREAYEKAVVDIRYQLPERHQYDKVVEVIRKNDQYEVVEK